MTAVNIVGQFNKHIKMIQTEDFYDYFPHMINQLYYIWNGLIDDISSLKKKDYRNHIYRIQECIITYLMEMIKLSTKMQYQIDLKYDIDEIKTLLGSAAYSPTDDTIYLSVFRMVDQAMNTGYYIQSILHEREHKWHHMFYQSQTFVEYNAFPPYYLLIGKHYVYTQWKNNTDLAFYLDNYNSIYPEVDAETMSLKRMTELIPGLVSIYETKYTIGNEVLEKILTLQSQIREDAEEIEMNLIQRGRIRNQSSKELYEQEDITTYFTPGEDSLIMVDQYIKDHPSLQEKYPFLRVLLIGDRIKNYDDFQKEKSQYSKELWRIIIKSDPYLQYQEYQLSGNEEKMRSFLKRHPSFQPPEKPFQKIKEQ